MVCVSDFSVPPHPWDNVPTHNSLHVHSMRLHNWVRPVTNCLVATISLGICVGRDYDESNSIRHTEECLDLSMPTMDLNRTESRATNHKLQQKSRFAHTPKWIISMANESNAIEINLHTWSTTITANFNLCSRLNARHFLLFLFSLSVFVTWNVSVSLFAKHIHFHAPNAPNAIKINYTNTHTRNET